MLDIVSPWLWSCTQITPSAWQQRQSLSSGRCSDQLATEPSRCPAMEWTLRESVHDFELWYREFERRAVLIKALVEKQHMSQHNSSTIKLAPRCRTPFRRRLVCCVTATECQHLVDGEGQLTASRVGSRLWKGCNTGGCCGHIVISSSSTLLTSAAVCSPSQLVPWTACPEPRGLQRQDVFGHLGRPRSQR